MKRVQITLEVDFENEYQFRYSFYFYKFIQPAIADQKCLYYLIEEVQA